MGLKEILKRKSMFVGTNPNEIDEQQRFGYLFAKKDYVVRNTELATFMMPAENYDLAESNMKEGIELKVPKIPYKILMEVLGYSALMNTKKIGLFYVLWNGEQYRLTIPKQKAVLKVTNRGTYEIIDDEIAENETLLLAIEVNNACNQIKNSNSDIKFKEKPYFISYINRSKLCAFDVEDNDKINPGDLFETPMKKERIHVEGVNFNETSVPMTFKEDKFPIYKGLSVDETALDNIEFEKVKISVSTRSGGKSEYYNTMFKKDTKRKKIESPFDFDKAIGTKNRFLINALNGSLFIDQTKDELIFSYVYGTADAFEVDEVYIQKPDFMSGTSQNKEITYLNCNQFLNILESLDLTLTTAGSPKEFNLITIAEAEQEGVEAMDPDFVNEITLGIVEDLKSARFKLTMVVNNDKVSADLLSVDLDLDDSEDIPF